MRDYGKISTTIWDSRKFSKTDDDARLLYLYLHTCKSVNSIGCFVLKDGYAVADLGWDVKRYRKAIETLCKAYLIAFDRGESLVRIINFMHFDPFTNPNHARGAIKIAFNLPDCEEKLNVFKDIQVSKHVKESDEIIKAIETLSKPFRNPEPEPEPEPEPKKEEETFVSSKKKPQQKSKPKTKRATSLPEGWVPSERNIEDAKKAQFSGQEIDHEATKFRDYHLAKGTTFKNWDAGWRTWLRNSREFASNRRMAGASPAGGRGQGGGIAGVVARRQFGG